MSVAAIDIGTITARILILGPAGERTRARFFCRLGEGLDQSGRLSGEALRRLDEAMESFAAMIDQAGAHRVRVVATSAARDAENSEELVAIVERHLGLRPEVLSGQAEGELAFAGASRGHLRADERALLIDIGGGSTEFVLGTRGGDLESFSTDMGASRITEAYLASDPPRAEELSAALSVVELHVIDARLAIEALRPAAAGGPVIGIGGTITTLAAIEMAMDDYDPDRVNGFVLTRPALEDCFRALATESSEDRLFNPGLGANRVETIVGGMCVLVETMRQLEIDEVIVSDFGLLDGVAASLVSDSSK